MASLVVIYVPCNPVPVLTTEIKYDENVKQSHQLNSETQQMHSINKLDIFFTYTANIF